MSASAWIEILLFIIIFLRLCITGIFFKRKKKQATIFYLKKKCKEMNYKLVIILD